MRNQENKKYIKLGLTGVAVVLISLLCFFIFFRTRSGMGALAGVLTPFFLGAIIAYILAPVCNRIEGLLIKLFKPLEWKRKLRSGIAITVSLLLAIALIWVLVMLVIPQVWSSLVSIANSIPGQLTNLNSKLHDLLESHPELQAYWDEASGRAAAGIESWLRTDIMTTVGTVISGVGTQVAVFFRILKDLFVGILVSVYFLASRKQFAAQGRMMLYGIFSHHWARLIEDEVRYADKMFNGFLMGKLLDSAIMGVICFAVTTLLHFQSAVLISVIVGVTNIIPFFGPFIGAIPSAIILLLQNPVHCLYFLIFILILQQVDGNIIGPKILGNTTGLSSFWVLFAILLFGGLWGVVGMIIGVPLFAVIYDIIRRIILHGLNTREHGYMIKEYSDKFYPPVPEKEPPKKKRWKPGNKKP